MPKNLKEHLLITASVIIVALLVLPIWGLRPKKAKADLPSGLLAGYSFDEGSGTTLNDINGGTNGTLTGGPTWVSGKYGNALSFDGVNDYIAMPSGGFGSFVNRTSFTFTFWESSNVLTGSGRMVADHNSTGNLASVSFEITSSQYRFRANNGSSFVSAQGGSTSAGWHHIAGTYDDAGDLLSLYVDGTLTATNTLTGTLTTGTHKTIGRLGDFSTEYFGGLLDELRIYNRALSQSEIQTDMNTPTDSTAPSIPGSSSATAASSTQISLSWAASTDNVRVNAYKIYRDSVLLTTTTATSYLDTNLTPSTAYSYGVSAYDPAGNESSQASSNATTLAGPDTTPPSRSNGSPSGVLEASTTQTTLTLNTSEAATCKYATSSGVGYGSMPATFGTTGGASHSQTVSGLINGGSYNYYVRCQDSALNANSDDYQISFSVPVPGQDSSAPVISGVSASTVGINTATIVWTTNEPADSQVEYGTSTYDLLSGLDTNPITNHSVLIFGLKSDSTYNFRVKSRDNTGNLSISGNFTFTTSKAAGDVDPPTISDISATVTYATATIIWVTDEPATSKVEYGLSTTYTASTTRDVILKRTHSVTIHNLEPKTKYNFRVISNDVSENMSISGNFTFTTDRIPAILVPNPEITGVKIAAVRPNSAKIEWKTNVPATSRIIFGESKDDLSGSTIELSTLTTTHSITLSDLIPKTKYFFSAISRNAADTATSSALGEFETPSIEIQQLVDVARPDALPPGSTRTLIPKISAGETVTTVPILPTTGDASPPEVILFEFDENPTEDTTPTFFGRAFDARGVIAAVSYSTDGGLTWLPISQITGIGTSNTRFSVTASNLRDGNYDVVFRVKDNSGNVGYSPSRSFVVDERPPSTGANALFLGTQSVVPSSLGTVQTLAGMVSKIVTTALGGAIKIEVIATKTDGPKEEKTSSTFPLSHFKSADLWYGDIKIEKPGVYDLKIKSDDGTGATSVRPVNPFSVADPGIIKNIENGEPIKGARVSIYQFFEEQNRFILWPGEIYNQSNPQITQGDGIYRFILPPGKYYLKAERAGFQTLYTDITEFKSHSILALSLPLAEKPYIKIIGKKIHLPVLPDFLGSKRATVLPQVSTPQSQEIFSLLNKPAPIFNLPDTKGESVDLRYLRGKRTIITVWSTWSPLAQAQIPIVDKAQRILGDDARFLLVSLQESAGIIDNYLRRGGYGVTGIVDQEGRFADKYPVLTTPQHFFIDRKGNIRDIFVGFLDEKALLEKAREL